MTWQGIALLDAGRWYVLGYALAVITFIGVRNPTFHVVATLLFVSHKSNLPQVRSLSGAPPGSLSCGLAHGRG